MSDIRKVRKMIGAKKGEDIVQALLRYARRNSRDGMRLALGPFVDSARNYLSLVEREAKDDE